MPTVSSQLPPGSLLSTSSQIVGGKEKPRSCNKQQYCKKGKYRVRYLQSHPSNGWEVFGSFAVCFFIFFFSYPLGRHGFRLRRQGKTTYGYAIGIISIILPFINLVAVFDGRDLWSIILGDFANKTNEKNKIKTNDERKANLFRSYLFSPDTADSHGPVSKLLQSYPFKLQARQGRPERKPPARSPLLACLRCSLLSPTKPCALQTIRQRRHRSRSARFISALRCLAALLRPIPFRRCQRLPYVTRSRNLRFLLS